VIPAASVEAETAATVVTSAAETPKARSHPGQEVWETSICLLEAAVATAGQQQPDSKQRSRKEETRARSTFFKGIRRYVSSLSTANVPGPQDSKAKARVLADQNEKGTGDEQAFDLKNRPDAPRDHKDGG